jgi:SagB-type dehydrogenase family enzyme
LKRRADVPLPAPQVAGSVALEHAIRKRRSCRIFSGEPLALSDLGQLLWAAQGVTGLGGLRAVPSAGAVYPLRTYVIAGDVQNLAPGVFLYDCDSQVLKPLLSGDKRRALVAAAADQECFADAAALILFAAVYSRMHANFGPRGERLAHIEAGHCGQNVCLQATALGLGVIGLGVFDDAAVKELLEIPERETPLYFIALGRK